MIPEDRKVQHILMIGLYLYCQPCNILQVYLYLSTFSAENVITEYVFLNLKLAS